MTNHTWKTGKQQCFVVSIKVRWMGQGHCHASLFRPSTSIRCALMLFLTHSYRKSIRLSRFKSYITSCITNVRRTKRTAGSSKSARAVSVEAKHVSDRLWPILAQLRGNAIFDIVCYLQPVCYRCCWFFFVKPVRTHGHISKRLENKKKRNKPLK